MAVIVTLKWRYKLQPLIDFGGRYIYRNDHEKNEYNRICSDQMDITMRDFIIKFATIIFSFVVATTSPMILYFMNGIRSTTSVEVHLPLMPAQRCLFYNDRLSIIIHYLNIWTSLIDSVFWFVSVIFQLYVTKIQMWDIIYLNCCLKFWQFWLYSFSLELPKIDCPLAYMEGKNKHWQLTQMLMSNWVGKTWNNRK